MTSAEIKSKFPEAAAEIATAAVTDERDRISGYMEYADVDIDAVKEGIASGKAPTHKFHSEMTRKLLSKEGINNMQAAAPAAITPEEALANKTEAQRKADAADKELNDALGIK